VKPRSPLKRSTVPLRRLTPLRKVSKKRARLLRERSKVRAFVLLRDGGCKGAAVVPSVSCSGPLDVHELVRRSQWREGFLHPENCVLLCRGHHDFVHANPSSARAVGLLLRSHERGAA
jgi:hypothetical protein